jgi:hypothetical protein
MKTHESGKAARNCCDEQLVMVSGEKLTTTCDNGDEHHYTVAKDSKVTCDGKKSQLSDLKKGSTIRMTLCQDDDQKVTAIDAGQHIRPMANN